MSQSLTKSVGLAAFFSIIAGYIFAVRSKKGRDGDDAGFSVWGVAPLLTAALACTIGCCYLWLRVNYPKWWADMRSFLKLVQWDSSMKKKMRSGQTILDVFEEHVQSQPHRPCILFHDETYTYREVDEQANRVARWVKAQDVAPDRGESVCMLLYNGPEFIWTCVGLMKLGVVASLINTNLKPTAILHCIDISEAKKLIFGAELWSSVKDILPELVKRDIDVWMVDDARVNAKDLKLSPEVVTMDTSMMLSAPYSRDAFRLTDMAIYIFTSGTTGMPKAVNVLHRKIVRATYLHFFSDLTPTDVYYIALPLYHSAALLQGVFSIWYYGGTAAIAKKFSASRFWDDIRRYRATGFHYIGEICRYLLAQPEREDDGIYPRKLRFAQGNGLRPEIWRQFQSRFKIGRVFEIYAATEGNFGIINVDGKVGTVGRYPWFLKKIADTFEIVEYDFESGEPKRRPDGFCQPLPNGKTGLALKRINENNPYTGYKGSEEMSKKKIITNVKKAGDKYFNTGDLLLIDHDGYIYFKDRVGDTFRWKGENVSTVEVSRVVNTCDGVSEANVYGVQIPGQDGRAGMAAIVMQDDCTLDYRKTYCHFSDMLPAYACPKFLRIMDQLEVTGTFKHKKGKLVEEGWNAVQSNIDDPVYVVDVEQKTYVPLTSEHVKLILEGRMKL